MTTKCVEFRRQISEHVEHCAPTGRFRAMACDAFEDSFADYLVGDFSLRRPFQPPKPLSNA
jgi:hypothetical protein